jgi:hypothetical protein
VAQRSRDCVSRDQGSSLTAVYGMSRVLHPSQEEFARELLSASDADFCRLYYCFYLGNVYVQLSLLEQTIMDALLMCNKFDDVLRVSGQNAQEFIRKQRILHASTLGSLLKYMEKGGVGERGLSYLRYLKDRRDLFVHNFFHSHAWPGDLRAQDAQWHIRRLRFLELTFARGVNRIWKILSDSGLFVRVDLGPNGALLYNTDLFDPQSDLFDA